MGTAARASILAAFTSAQGYSADADYSPKAWLINRTRITKGTAVVYTAWVRRAAAHPEVVRVLAAGELSESYARMICAWTDKLPEDCREAADAILVTAARAGMDVRDLAGLAAEIYARSLPADPDKDRDEAFEDRSVKLETTFDGAGRPDRRPDPGVRLGGDGGAGRAVRPGRRGGHPDVRPAVPRRAAGGDAAAGHRRAAARAGRAAGESPGARLPRRPDGPGRQLGAAGGVEQPGPRPVGGAPGRGFGGRQRRRRVAGRRRRPGRGLRRGDDPDRDRRGQPGRPG